MNECFCEGDGCHIAAKGGAVPSVPDAHIIIQAVELTLHFLIGYAILVSILPMPKVLAEFGIVETFGLQYLLRMY